MDEGKKYNDLDKIEVHFKNNLCIYCGKALRRFRNKTYGYQTNRPDWRQRKSHLKCWKNNRY